jgi:hypothetical protein
MTLYYVTITNIALSLDGGEELMYYEVCVFIIYNTRRSSLHHSDSSLLKLRVLRGGSQGHQQENNFSVYNWKTFFRIFYSRSTEPEKFRYAWSLSDIVQK